MEYCTLRTSTRGFPLGGVHSFAMQQILTVHTVRLSTFASSLSEEPLSGIVLQPVSSGGNNIVDTLSLLLLQKSLR